MAVIFMTAKVGLVLFWIGSSSSAAVSQTCEAGVSSEGCNADAPSNSEMHCWISEGADLSPPRRLSMSAAVEACKALSGCKAITAFQQTDGREPSIFFKSQSSPCTPSERWRSVIVDQPEEESQQEASGTPWAGPPDLEYWRSFLKLRILKEDPPVVQFDNFLSDEEVDYILKMAEPRLEPSTTGMSYKAVSDRKSMTAWLNGRKDQEDKVLNGINMRISALTNVRPTNMEPFQVLRYGPGEFYKAHHDYLEAQEDQPCGPRVARTTLVSRPCHAGDARHDFSATFFMYLSNVTSGGRTRFPKLNLTVAPRRGRAVLWWNVDHAQLRKAAAEGGPVQASQDERAWHAALPVKQGEKWVVNRWLHPSDFLEPYFAGKLV